MKAKKNAAAKAVDLIQDGMTVGLGSGSTASHAIERIAERVQQGLKIRAVATSVKSEALAKRLGIQIVNPGEVESIDIAIDGADEVDQKGNVIKGGGGSLLREKIIAFASDRFYVMVDDTKLTQALGTHRLPVEIVPFAASHTLKHIRMLGGEPVLRQGNGTNFITDNGNLVADCSFGVIEDPALLDVKLKMIPGVVETGLFLNQIITGIFIGFESRETKMISVSP